MENGRASAMKEENERLRNELKNMQNELEAKNKRMEEMRLEMRRQEAQKIEKIQHTNRSVQHDFRYEGLVITRPLKYVVTDERNRRIKTFNWVYSPKLGLLRSLNKRRKPKMEFGYWYTFRTCDERKKHKNTRPMRHVQALRATHRRKTRKPRNAYIDENGELTVKQIYLEYREFYFIEFQLTILLEFKYVVLSGTRQIILDDQFLNGVLLPQNMKDELLRAIGTGVGEGTQIAISTFVKVREGFLDYFNWNENAAMFEVKKIRNVRVGNRWIRSD